MGHKMDVKRRKKLSVLESSSGELIEDSERNEGNDRSERNERNERSECSERNEGSERSEYIDSGSEVEDNECNQRNISSGSDIEANECSEQSSVSDSSESSNKQRKKTKKATTKKRKTKSNPVGSFIIHSKHTEVPKEKKVMKYMSFDPGTVNFAIRIEKRRKSKKGNKCKKISTIVQTKKSIRVSRRKKKNYTLSYFTQDIIDILDSYSKEYKDLDIVLIERQMKAPMVYVQHIVINYFLVKYPEVCTIELSSTLKSKKLKAGKLSRPKLKKWTIDTAMELSKERNDKAFLTYIKEKTEGKKKSEIKIDDECDTLIQIEAFCVEVGYQTTR